MADSVSYLIGRVALAIKPVETNDKLCSEKDEPPVVGVCVVQSGQCFHR